MTDEALALAFRFGLPFVGLRDHTPDPELDRIVPPVAARTARALPLAAQDDHIRLAVAEPDPDLSALDPYLAGHEIDLALAPREELDAILGPPPPVAEPEQPVGEAPERGADEADEAEPLAAEANGGEPTPLAAEHTAPPETDEPEPITAAAGAGSEPLAAEHTAPPESDEPEPITAAAAIVEPEPLTADHTARPEIDERAPLVAAAGDESEPVAADHTAPSATVDPEPLAAAASGAEPAYAEPAAARADEEGPAGGLGPGGEAAVLAAEPTTSVDDHPELAGEVPSWLEPRRRAGRVVLTVLIVIVVLAAAAAILIAVANA